MRAWFAILPALLLSGCFYDWSIRGEEPPTGLRNLMYFEDADGDGWGVGDGQEANEPDETFKVRNNRDCDDGNDQVTARVGSICPEQLVTGAVQTEGRVTSDGREFLWVYGTTPEVWPAAADAACGPWGWGGEGGGLATFDSDSEIEGVVSAIIASAGGTAPAAGYFIGAQPDGTPPDEGTASSPPTPAGGWTWEGSYGLGSGLLTWCDPADPPLSVPGPDRLALFITSGSAMCLDVPEDNVGFFICERPVPDAEKYEVASPEPEGE